MKNPRAAGCWLALYFRLALDTPGRIGVSQQALVGDGFIAFIAIAVYILCKAFLRPAYSLQAILSNISVGDQNALIVQFIHARQPTLVIFEFDRLRATFGR